MILSNAWIVTMDDAGTEFERGWLRVENGLIAELGAGDPPPRAQETTAPARATPPWVGSGPPATRQDRRRSGRFPASRSLQQKREIRSPTLRAGPPSARAGRRYPVAMAVKLRLTRVGSKKNPIYRVVAADSRSPRDGRFLEIVGRYNPQTDPSTIDLDEAKVKDWLGKGAQPTEAVFRLLKAKGLAS